MLHKLFLSCSRHCGNNLGRDYIFFTLSLETNYTLYTVTGDYTTLFTLSLETTLQYTLYIVTRLKYTLYTVTRDYTTLFTLSLETTLHSLHCH